MSSHGWQLWPHTISQTADAMDEIVRRAMQKWPHVPAVFGWLSLDARGNWLIRGERVTNPLLNKFIDRNYACDEHGRWFFQNGPQRVFVTLDYAPWVLRVHLDELITHTGRTIGSVGGAWVDESGVVVISTERGAGTMDDRDVDTMSSRFIDASAQVPPEDRLIESVENLMVGRHCDLYLPYAGRTVRILPIRRIDVPSQFGFVASPTPAAGEGRNELDASAA